MTEYNFGTTADETVSEYINRLSGLADAYRAQSGAFMGNGLINVIVGIVKDTFRNTPRKVVEFQEYCNQYKFPNYDEALDLFVEVLREKLTGAEFNIEECLHERVKKLK